MDKTKLIALLKLPAEATDEDIETAIVALQTAADDAAAAEQAALDASEAANSKADEAATQTEALENSLNTLQADFSALRTELNNTLLDAAIRDGRITKAERGDWEKELEGKDREGAMNSLGKRKPQLNTKGIDVSGQRGTKAAQDATREDVFNAVTKRQKQDGLSYDEAWNAVKRDAQFAGYFNQKPSNDK